MFTYRVLNSNNATNSLFIRGSKAEDNTNDIASIVFQNYDTDTSAVYKMAEIAIRDEFGNASSNGIGNLIFKTNPTGSNLVEQVRLTYDGHLLLGTSNNGTDTLTVNGTMGISGGLSAGSYLASNDSSNMPGFSWKSDSNTGMYMPAANTLALVTDSNERFRITPTGNVAVNTLVPKERLEVVGNVLATNVQKITKTTNSLGSLDIQLNWQNAYGSNQYFIVLETYQEVANGTQQGVRYQRHTIRTFNAGNSSSPSIQTQQTAQIWGNATPNGSMSIVGVYTSPSNLILRSSTNWATTGALHHSFCLNTVLVPETSNLGQVWLS
jgi:hypothetical protein